MALRIGVASIVQETNTFAPQRCTLADFEVQGMCEGERVREVVGVNTEAGGAIAELEGRGATAVPVLWAWAMSSGRLTDAALEGLATRLRESIADALPLDGLVLSLHGACASETVDDATLVLLRAARAAIGPAAPIGVCLDLHANVTRGLVEECEFVIGYHTYPHVDQARTGARTSELLLDLLEGRGHPVTSLAKRPMLVPPEAQDADGPLGEIREAADRATTGDVLDISLFPVQPWLDVADLGASVLVTTDARPAAGQQLAERFAQRLWDRREDFVVDLVDPGEAIRAIVPGAGRPVILSESADSPTAGAAADSPAMVRALLEHGDGLRALTTLVDPPAVAHCHDAGAGAAVSLQVGCSIDDRFHEPVALTGVVRRLGDGAFSLTGPVFTGMEVTMGRYAVVQAGGLSVLVTERPACTFDPESYRYAGLEPAEADVVVVRSATLFRAGYGDLAAGARILDLPGASTPRLASLKLSSAPRPIYPLDL